MCSRPSTSLPDLMRWSVVASVFSSTAIVVDSSVGLACRLCVCAILAQPFEVAAARGAAVLAEQQLRAKQRYQLCRRGVAERALWLTHGAEDGIDTLHTRARARSTYTRAIFLRHA